MRSQKNEIFWNNELLSQKHGMISWNKLLSQNNKNLL